MRFKTLALVALGLPAVLAAQSIDSLSLTGRSSINLGIGLTGQRSASVGFGGLDAHVTGELGSLGFTHWIRPEVAITIGAASLSAEANVAGAHAGTSSVTALLFGVNYSPRALALSSTLRPYVALAAGPYFHSVAEANPFGGDVGSSVESVAGMRTAIGANWFVAQHFFLSLEGDYNAISHFSKQDGMLNPNGFGVSFGFGFNWGGR
jgi:hypothetical protein